MRDPYCAQATRSYISCMFVLCFVSCGMSVLCFVSCGMSIYSFIYISSYGVMLVRKPVAIPRDQKGGRWSGALLHDVRQGCCCFSQELSSRGLASARSTLPLLPLVERQTFSANFVGCASSSSQVNVEDLRLR
jgi:hypothetical protein